MWLLSFKMSELCMLDTFEFISLFMQASHSVQFLFSIVRHLMIRLVTVVIKASVGDLQVKPLELFAHRFVEVVHVYLCAVLQLSSYELHSYEAILLNWIRNALVIVCLFKPSQTFLDFPQFSQPFSALLSPSQVFTGLLQLSQTF